MRFGTGNSGLRVFAVVLSMQLGVALLAPASSEAAKGTLRIVTYNIWGLPKPLLVLPSRIPLIRDTAPALGADVIAFQETFTKDARILANLPGYPFHAWGPPKVKGKQSSGLLVVSRFPIVHIESVNYSDCKGTDCFAQKGALHTRIEVPGTGEIDVFTTHLNAGGDEAVRISQGNELRAFIERQASGRPIIVLGDFNFMEDSVPYFDMIRTGRMRDLHDEYRGANPSISPIEWNGFTIDTKRNKNIKIAQLVGIKPRRIDFIFARDHDCSRTIARRTRLVYDQVIEKKHLSDHFGVMADLEIESAAHARCAEPSARSRSFSEMLTETLGSILGNMLK